MKPKLLVMGMVLAGLAVQPALTQPAYLGFEGGANFAYLNGSDANTAFGSRLGFVGGGFAHLGLFPGLAFQPEVLYTQKGAQTNNGQTTYRLDYVEIPALLDISLGLPVVDILLGPSFDANVVTEGFQNVNPVDVWVIGGLQAHFDPILLSGRYEVGLTNVTSNRNMQNGTFTFLVGIAFL